MDDRHLLRVGLVGTIVAAVCCFTPLLVLTLSAVGLSAAVAWLDLGLLPLLGLFVFLSAYAGVRLARIKRRRTL